MIEYLIWESHNANGRRMLARFVDFLITLNITYSIRTLAGDKIVGISEEDAKDEHLQRFLHQYSTSIAKLPIG